MMRNQAAPSTVAATAQPITATPADTSSPRQFERFNRRSARSTTSHQ